MTGPRRLLLFAILLLGSGTILAYAGVPTPVAFSVLAAGAVLLWWLDLETIILGYTASLAVQVIQSLAVFRVAVADLFMLPAAVKSAVAGYRAGEGLPESTLTRPFVLLLVLFAIANVVAVAETGHLSGYAIVNKDLGILYLVAGYYT